MENRSKKDSPSRPSDNGGGRKADGSGSGSNSNSGSNPNSGPSGTPGGSPAPPWIWILLLVAGGLLLMMYPPFGGEPTVDYHPWFLRQVQDDNIKSILVQGSEGVGVLRAPKEYAPAGSQQTKRTMIEKFKVYFPTEADIKETLDRLRLSDNEKGRVPARIDVKPPQGPNALLWMTLLLPLVILAVFWMMMRRARDQFDGGILGNFVRSPAKRHDKSKQRVTFEQVAGLENAKSELQEIVDFLKNPEKFQRLGGRIPKGVLLVGPPGSGKTLLARAVAGEAGVPFFSISGSEFIQMFVGVGASRVRDMFKTAKENSPCILFVDEIDAVGRVRGAGLGGGHDEREQTLNQILTEMDGFTPNESVIVLAATNRPDVLDPALLRPGRFDRHVTVDRPTRKGRLEILKVHTRNKPLADDVDLDAIARATVGMSGADLENLANEAALIAVRQDKDRVDMADFEAARDKVLMGSRREEVITDKDKRMTAYHESGHALVAWLLPNADPVVKVTVIPRGRSLGATQYQPEEDKVSYAESEMRTRLATILGGRAAERLVYNDLTAGAAGDLKQATRLARMMVTQWGMSERVGPVFFQSSEEHPFLGREMSESRDHSEDTARVIDEEVARILREADERALALLRENRDKLERLTDALVEREVLSVSEIEELIGKRAGAAAAPPTTPAPETPAPAENENPRNGNGHNPPETATARAEAEANSNPAAESESGPAPA